jgi:hypothetical protein
LRALDAGAGAEQRGGEAQPEHEAVDDHPSGMINK